MSMKRLYFGLENVALTGPQKQTLVDGLKLLGPSDDDMPSHINHWRARLDSDALIFEALFDDSLLSVAAFKTRLASIFGVAVGSITSSTSNPAAGTSTTFSYQATPRFRVLLFGGASATYAESQAAARQYLADNAATWESLV